MRLILSLFVFIFIQNPLFSQVVYRLDDSAGLPDNSIAINKVRTQTTPTVNISVQEHQLIEELISTIEAVLFENGEEVNIAKQRNIPALKADADIPTFLKFTQSDSGKKKVIAACQEVQLIRFSFFNEKDFDLAKSIDFKMLNQFPQLQYLVFYVDPAVYKQHPNKQEGMIKQKLEDLVKIQLKDSPVKIFYRIPNGG